MSETPTQVTVGDARPEEDEFEAAWKALQRLWLALRKRWPVVVAVTGLCCLAAFVRLRTLPDRFEAEGLVQVGMYADVMGDPERPLGSRVSQMAANTHLKLLTSDQVAELALERLGQPVPEGPERRRVIDDFLEQVSVDPLKDTFLVRVSSAGSGGKQVAARVNALMDAFIPFSNQFFGSRYLLLQRTLTQREESVRAKLREAEDQLQALYRKNGRVNFTDRRSTLQATQAELQSKLTELQITRASVAAEQERLEQALDQRAGKEEAVALLLGRLQGGGSESAALKQLRELRGRMSQLRSTLREDHPEFVSRQRELVAEEGALRQEIFSASRARLAALGHHQSVLDSQEEKLSALLKATNKELQELDRQEGIYSSVKREVEWYEKELQAIREQLRRSESRSQVDMAAQIVNRADVPLEPISRFKPTTVVMILLASLGLGLGIVVLWDRLEDRVTDPGSVRSLGLPVLGHVPHADLQPGQELSLLLGELKPASARAAEAYRVIRTNLTFAAAGLRHKAIIVTSGNVADGKSITTTQLGVALAQSGGRTLLVEGDLRRPRLQKILQSPHEQGLSNVLAGELSFEDAVQPTDFPNLSLLPAGPTPPNAADLLVQGRFDEIIARAKEQFDHVVIDTPPVVGIADTSLMAGYADGIVFVLKLHHSRRRNLEAAVEQVASTGCRGLGLIVNGVTGREGYGYYYGDGYKYYQAEGTRNATPA